MMMMMMKIMMMMRMMMMKISGKVEKLDTHKGFTILISFFVKRIFSVFLN